jgi:hypothetical protein
VRRIKVLPDTLQFIVCKSRSDFPESASIQRHIIVSSLGFTALQTTLLGCLDGVVTIWVRVTGAAKILNRRAHMAALYLIPDLIGVFLVNFLPWDNKIGLLFAVWTTGKTIRSKSFFQPM